MLFQMPRKLTLKHVVLLPVGVAALLGLVALALPGVIVKAVRDRRRQGFYA